MPEGHNYLILIPLHVPKLRYGDHAQKCKPLLHCTQSFECGDIDIFGL